MSELPPRLWSDFDGTAIGLAKNYDPRNWVKYWLPAIEGYADFLKGVQSTGVEIAGVVSRRPAVRRWVTQRSIKELGFAEFFTNPDQVVLKGGEREKGRFVAEESHEGPVGMLEDKPHKLGVELLGALREASEHPRVSHHPILLGVVSHGQSQAYMRGLAESVGRNHPDLSVDVSTPGKSSGDFTVTSEGFAVHVTQLEPYTEAAGQDFGQRLHDLAAS
ncbi:MAG TPA: hypothetical protein VFX86_04830 [Candidatus Saccharimonadales bacterium]|nr:hypothetical protein [Candidatus Saccharimonadales bacterium]